MVQFGHPMESMNDNKLAHYCKLLTVGFGSYRSIIQTIAFLFHTVHSGGEGWMFLACLLESNGVKRWMVLVLIPKQPTMQSCWYIVAWFLHGVILVSLASPICKFNFPHEKDGKLRRYRTILQRSTMQRDAESIFIHFCCSGAQSGRIMVPLCNFLGRGHM